MANNKLHEMKQPAGTWEVVRKLKILGLNSPDDGHVAEESIRNIPGVLEVTTDIDNHILAVRYDASQIDYLSIIGVLKEANYPIVDNWWSRIKGSLFQYSDTNARDNAKVPPPACCNKPPK